MMKLKIEFGVDLATSTLDIAPIILFFFIDSMFYRKLLEQEVSVALGFKKRQ